MVCDNCLGVEGGTSFAQKVVKAEMLVSLVHVAKPLHDIIWLMIHGVDDKTYLYTTRQCPLKPTEYKVST